MEKLCPAYWPPLHANVRRSAYSLHEAQDLTQEFFSQILADDSLAAVAPQKGMFRSCLLAFLKHFLVKKWKRNNTQKQASGKTIVCMDALERGRRNILEPRDHETPETPCDRRLARTVLSRGAGQGICFGWPKVYLLQGL